MDRDSEEVGELESEDMVVVRATLSRIIGMEIPAIGVDSEATFKGLKRALDRRRDHQRRRRLLIGCSLGAATVIVGLIMLLRP
jgi:hypothetical protein